MYKLALALALLPAMASTAHSDARDPVTLLSGLGLDGTPDLVSEGDLSAVLRNSSTTKFALQVSDGRGLTWSTPLEVDPPGSTDEIHYRKAAIVGDEVFVIFADDRYDQALFGSTPTSTTFLRVYDHTTGILGAEQEVPTGITPENLVVIGFDFVAREVAGATHLHLAMAQRERDPVTGSITEEVVLYSSHDGGASWLAPLVVGPTTHDPFENVRVLADGGQVSVVFHGEVVPGTFGSPYQVLFHQRSLDAGLSTDYVAPVYIPGPLTLTGWDVDFRGSVMAITYEQFSSSPGKEVFATASTDGGATFSPPVQVLDPVTGSAKYAFDPKVVISGTGGDICVVAFCSSTGGGDMLVSYHSADGGQSWPDQERAILGAGSRPQIVASRLGRERIVVTCRPVGFGSGVDEIRTAVSYDRGKSFEPWFVVMKPGLDIQSSLAWNDLYQNALVGYGDFKSQVVGGFRPQEFLPQGFAVGGTSLSADFRGFDGDAELVWLLMSTDTTSLPLPLGDGRELGIGVTPLFVSTLPIALGGLFAATLSPSGNGSTHLVPLASPGVPAGLHLHLVGLSWDVDTATFVDISDVIKINT